MRLWTNVAVIAMATLSSANAQQRLYDTFDTDAAVGFSSSGTAHSYSIANPSALSVSGSRGLFNPSPGTSAYVSTSYTLQDAEVSATFQQIGEPAGWVESGLAVRQLLIGNTVSQAYQAFLKFDDDRLWLIVRKVINNQYTTLFNDEYLVDPADGDSFSLKFRTIGTNPTVLQVKFWPKGFAEPSEWDVTLSDDDPSLQNASGGAGFAFRSNSQVAEPNLDIGVDDLWIKECNQNCQSDIALVTSNGTFAPHVLATNSYTLSGIGNQSGTFLSGPLPDGANFLKSFCSVAVLGQNDFGYTYTYFFDKSGAQLHAHLGCSAPGVSNGESAGVGDDELIPIPLGTHSIGYSLHQTGHVSGGSISSLTLTLYGLPTN